MEQLTNNFRLGKNLNIETKYNSHTGKSFTIERVLRKMSRGWGKHRIEDEWHTCWCERLGRFVTYQKGKPKKKEFDKLKSHYYNKYAEESED
jgi:hypothetical protein